MSVIPGPDLRSIAEELRETEDAPHGLPTYDWRYTEETGRRVLLPEQESGGPTGHGPGGRAKVAVDFEDGPGCRFTYDGVEYEAAWRRWYRVVAYRVVPGSDRPEPAA